ncbi:hypothetical protein FRX31_006783 [Thalictrum thalictroides]|uniref:Uncharacterized protein n=1 Tax=Thalictrum thalictroides TaxID=46969 RepID=A0A7J6X4Y6_THATH|nr:hypothetical protein FRX31_006783 [Thalictrum thalictroides]
MWQVPTPTYHWECSKCPKPDSVKGKSTADRHHSAPISKKKSSLTISVVEDNLPQKKSKDKQSKKKGSFNSDRSEEDTDSDNLPLTICFSQSSKVTVPPNHPSSNIDKTDFDLSGVDIDLSEFAGAQIEVDDLTDMLVDAVASDVLPLVPVSEQPHSIDVDLLDSDGEQETILEQTVASTTEPQDCQPVLVSKKREASTEGKPSASGSQKSSLPCSSAIFSPSLMLNGKAVTVEDSAWREPTVEFMMTQHTTLPKDVAALKEMTDRNLKSSFFCLLSQLKDVGGEIIGGDDTKDSDIKSLKANRDRLIKDNELLKVSAEEGQRYKKLKHDFEQFKEQTAKSRKFYEDQLGELQLKVYQTKKKNINLEAEKLAYSTQIDEAKSTILSLTARSELAESRISTLDAELLQLRTDNKPLSFAHDCAVKGVNEKLLSLEAAIRQKDADCEAWYKDMNAKSKVAVAEQVKAKVAAFMKSIQSKSSVSPAPPPPTL